MTIKKREKRNNRHSPSLKRKIAKEYLSFVNIDINLDCPIIPIHLYDNMGRLARSYQARQGTFQMDISNLNQGLYNARLMVKGVPVLRRLVKQ